MLALIVAIGMLSFTASAVEVAFLEFHNEDGRRVELEPGGRFVHVAIRIDGRWLHAHTHEGVALIDSLEEYGHRIIRLENPLLPDPKLDQFVYWLGKPFDMTYSWRNPKATYCTRLVAELLNVPPQPMQFASDHWRLASVKPIGEPGLSPDDLFRILKQRGFKESARSCEDFLAR